MRKLVYIFLTVLVFTGMSCKKGNDNSTPGKVETKTDMLVGRTWLEAKDIVSTRPKPKQLDLASYSFAYDGTGMFSLDTYFTSGSLNTLKEEIIWSWENNQNTLKIVVISNGAVIRARNVRLNPTEMSWDENQVTKKFLSM